MQIFNVISKIRLLELERLQEFGLWYGTLLFVEVSRNLQQCGHQETFYTPKQQNF